MTRPAGRLRVGALGVGDRGGRGGGSVWGTCTMYVQVLYSRIGFGGPGLDAWLVCAPTGKEDAGKASSGGTRFQRCFMAVGGRATRELHLRKRFEVSDRLLDVMLDGISIAHVKKGQRDRIRFHVLDLGSGRSERNRGWDRGRRDARGGGTREPCMYMRRTRNGFGNPQALTLCSFLHPRVRKTLAKYGGAGQVWNAAARR